MHCGRATAPASTFTLRLRRIRLAPEDLGIAPIVGDRWATSTDNRIQFADIDEAVSDRLARSFEDLAHRPADAQRELSWFLMRRPPGLFTPTELRSPATGRFHICPEVPR